MIPRHLKPLILEALGSFPVVAILGSRQVGKSTLAQDLPSQQWLAHYLTLDDFSILGAAQNDPQGFIEGMSLPVILDEVQRAPDMLRAIKAVVDKKRKPGLFLLTGSANLLTLKSVSESLAGRVALFELFPFSWAEMALQPSPPATLDALFSCKTAGEFIDSLPSRTCAVSRSELTSKILSGGYPVPALMKPGRNRAQWFNSYRQTYLERDLREISNVASLPDFGRLLVSAAARTGKLLNLSELSRDLGIPVQTVRRHMGLLETTFQVWTVQPYYANINKRLVKTPKLYFCDTGLAANLLAADDWVTIERLGRTGALVETWVAAELRKLSSLAGKRTEIHFWRTHGGHEVDFLLARGEHLAGLEVKWSQQIGNSDIQGLESCRENLEGRLRLSVILYSGETAFAINDHIAAVPLTLFFQ